MPVWESELLAKTIIVPYNEQVTGSAQPPATLPGDAILATFTPEGGFAYIEGIMLNLTNNNAAPVNVGIFALTRSGQRILLNTITLNPGSVFNDWLRWMYDVLVSSDQVQAIEIVASFTDPNGTLDYTIRVTGLTSLPSVSQVTQAPPAGGGVQVA